jgi:hypothetical protein
MSQRAQLFCKDWSSSNDSIIEDLLDDDIEQYVKFLAVKELDDRKKQRHGSKVGRLLIPRNSMLGHILHMRDYYAEVPTYLSHLFRRRFCENCAIL